MLPYFAMVKNAEPDGAYRKVLYWFFAYSNKEISLSDLAAKLSISKTSANHIVIMLKEAGFLNIEVIGRVWRISAIQSHEYFITKKIPYNLGLIFESGILSDIHGIIENPRAIILFGSYRKGDDTEKSDVDIAIEVLDEAEPRIIQLKKAYELGYRKEVIVNLYVFSRRKIDINLFSNIANGIILEGFLEVKV